MLKHNVYELLDLTSRWLLDKAVCSVALDLDDIWMLEPEQYLDLLLDIIDGFLVFLQKLLLDQLERHLLFWFLNRSHKVHLGRVALSQRADDLVLTLEYWVFWLFSFHFGFLVPSL